MASTVQGSVGAANAGAIVTAILLVGAVAGQPGVGRPSTLGGGGLSPVVTSDVAANGTGNFSIGGLAAGTYEIKAVVNNSQLGNRQGSDVTNTIFVNTIQVDGSSTYKL